MAKRQLSVAHAVQQVLGAVAADAERPGLLEREELLERPSSRGQLVVVLAELRAPARLGDGVPEKERATSRAPLRTGFFGLAAKGGVKRFPHVDAAFGDAGVRAVAVARAEYRAAAAVAPASRPHARAASCVPSALLLDRGLKKVQETRVFGPRPVSKSSRQNFRVLT